MCRTKNRGVSTHAKNLLYCRDPVVLGDAGAQPQSAPSSANEREVRERLIRLEEGQKALSQRIEDVNANLSKRIEDVNANLSTQIADLRSDMNSRLSDMNSRLSDLTALLHIIISTLVALVLAIAGAGLVMWRKILTVDAAVQTKIGIDQFVKDQVLHLEQEVGFVKGKLRELNEALNQR